MGFVVLKLIGYCQAVVAAHHGIVLHHLVLCVEQVEHLDPHAESTFAELEAAVGTESQVAVGGQLGADVVLCIGVAVAYHHGGSAEVDPAVLPPQVSAARVARRVAYLVSVGLLVGRVAHIHRMGKAIVQLKTENLPTAHCPLSTARGVYAEDVHQPQVLHCPIVHIVAGLGHNLVHYAVEVSVHRGGQVVGYPADADIVLVSLFGTQVAGVERKK